MPSAEPRGAERREARLAYGMVAPAVATILLVALFPLSWTIWESLHLHDLRMPWLGQPFVGLENYVEVLGDRRFWGAMGHTVWFAVASVSLELVLGCVLALAMNRDLPRPGAGAGVHPDSLGDPHRRGGAGVALHVRGSWRAGSPTTCWRGCR